MLSLIAEGFLTTRVAPTPFPASFEWVTFFDDEPLPIGFVAIVIWAIDELPADCYVMGL